MQRRKMEMESRRASLLLNQLGRAQRKISTLEEFIRERERQLHSAVSRGRLDRRDSRPLNRIRRVGLSSDLLRMRSVSRDEEDPGKCTYTYIHVVHALYI